ncbi:MAG: CaiB/BaiF CoA-transferase family protein [Acidobacteriota bacterium]
MTASPLRDLLVVDLSRLLPGPLTARLLADLGARVLKVEEPRLGDPVRLAPPLVDGQSSLASLLLAGVESVALDLKKEAAREVLEAILEHADVLLDNLRPGTLARLGLSPELLRERHPRLIHCSLTGWGQGGPWATRSGHDLTYLAVAGGLASVPSLPALPGADLAGAWSALAAILAALHERRRTGRGMHIDASLFDAALHGNLLAWSEEAGGAKAVGDPLMLTGALPCYGVYRSRDDVPLALAALEPHFWERFCEAAERDDLRPLHLDRRPEARQQVADALAQRTAAEWIELAAAQDLPLEAILSPEAALEHPQAQHRGVVERRSDGSTRIAFPARLDGFRPRGGDRVPRLGEDTRAILDELGIEMSVLQRRSAGIGRRFSLRRLLMRWAVRRKGG